MAKKTRVNDSIRSEEVLLIDQDKENLGKVKTSKAKKMAKDASLDLVMVAENANPPVCRIMDYGKYQYEQKKKEQKSKKARQMKEAQFSLNIGDHDKKFKLKQAKSFLQDGHPVKVTMSLFGRQQKFSQRAKDQLSEIVEELKAEGEIDTPVKKEGRNLYAILKPD